MTLLEGDAGDAAEGQTDADDTSAATPESSASEGAGTTATQTERGELLDTWRLPAPKDEDEDEGEEEGEPEPVGDVELRKVDNCTRRIEVAYDPGYAADELRRGFAEINRSIQLDGFRRGKVPRPILESRFGTQVRDDLRQTFVNHAGRAAIEHFHLDVLGEPVLEDAGELNEREGFRFAVTVEVAPEFELADYKGLPAKEPELAVTDDEVEHELEHVREHHAAKQPIEDQPIEADDEVEMSYCVPAEGEPWLAEEDRTVEVEAGALVPEEIGLAEGEPGLVGMKPGETRRVKVAVDDGFRRYVREEAGDEAGDAADKMTEVEAEVSVKEARRTEMPELNDEFAQELGFENLDALRADTRQSAEAARRKQIDHIVREQLVRELRNRHTFDMPERLVTRHAEAQRRNQMGPLLRMGLTVEQLESMLGEVGEGELAKARDSLQEMFILDAIGKKEKLFVTEDDYQARVAEMAERFEVGPEEMESYIESQGVEQTVRSEIREEKIRDFLVANAAIEKVGADQFAVLSEELGLDYHRLHDHDHDHDEHEHDDEQESDETNG